MNTFMKTIAVAGALSLGAVSTAVADYALVEDTSLPSVLFVDFADDGTNSLIISAPGSNGPSSTSPSLSSSGAGFSDGDPDTMINGDNASSNNETTPQISKVSGANPPSFEQNVSNNLNDRENNPEQFAQENLENDVTDSLLENVELR